MAPILRSDNRCAPARPRVEHAAKHPLLPRRRCLPRSARLRPHPPRPARKRPRPEGGLRSSGVTAGRDSTRCLAFTALSRPECVESHPGNGEGGYVSNRRIWTICRPSGGVRMNRIWFAGVGAVVWQLCSLGFGFICRLGAAAGRMQEPVSQSVVGTGGAVHTNLRGSLFTSARTEQWPRLDMLVRATFRSGDRI